MAVKALLPLFPLDLVLVPGELLPLHIFEPRYRLMLSQKHSEGGEFGVVRQHAGTIERIGCAATVHAVTDRFDDGRFNVLVMGTRRFLVRMIDSSEECLQATVEFFDDEVPDSAGVDRARKLIEVARTALGANPDFAPDWGAQVHPGLSFQVTAGLRVGLETKQALLGMRSEAERVEFLIKHLEGAIAGRRASENRKLVAGSNGRLRH